MACSLSLSLAGKSFVRDGITYGSLTPNINSCSQSQIESTSGAMYLGYTGSLNQSLNSSVPKHYGFRLSFACAVSDDCRAYLTFPITYYYKVRWSPQYKDKSGHSYSGPIELEYFDALYPSDPLYLVNQLFDSNNNTLGEDLGISIKSGQDLSTDFQREINSRLAAQGEEFDRFVATPNFSIVAVGLYKGAISSYSFRCECSSDCVDIRSSSSTSEFFITINGQLPDGTDDSKQYSLLIQPDSNHTSGNITLSGTDGLYTAFKKFYGASVRMLDSVCCHDVGYIDIYGDVHVSGFGYSMVGDVFLPTPILVDRSNVLLLRARFDDECCCGVTGYTDEVTDILNDAFSDASSYDSSSIMLSYVQPKSISWSGFARLDDYCCDGSECDDSEPYDYDIQYPSDGSGGGGDNVDITCICDGLTALKNSLASKLDSIIEGQGIIAEAIEEIEVNVDSECICDNLESIDDKLGQIKTSIDDKDLSPVNNVTVQPPVNNVSVQPPVNNVSVQPPVNNVSVQQPVNNVTVEPCSPTVTVNPTDVSGLVSQLSQLQGIYTQVANAAAALSSVDSRLVCNNQNIACILDGLDISLDTTELEDKLEEINESLNTSTTEGGEVVNKSITDVIAEKDISSYSETIVEPCDYTYTRWASHNVDNS